MAKKKRPNGAKAHPLSNGIVNSQGKNNQTIYIPRNVIPIEIAIPAKHIYLEVYIS